MAAPKNKTVAVWLALVGGSLGLHRFYLRGLGDWVGWLHPLPTALGWWGIERVLAYGQDDKLSWVLIPLLGMSVAAACLTGIVYALADADKWDRWFNADAPGSRAPATPTGSPSAHWCSRCWWAPWPSWAAWPSASSATSSTRWKRPARSASDRQVSHDVASMTRLSVSNAATVDRPMLAVVSSCAVS